MPPLIHKKFECAGDGLTVSGHRRVSPTDLEFALGIQTPGLTLPSGAERIVAQKHPKLWWEAQVRLYGLKCTKWTVDGMKKVLFDAVKEGIEVSAEINALEERLNKEYAEMENESQDTPSDAFDDGMKRAAEILRLTSLPRNATAEDRAKRKAEMNNIIEASGARQLAKMNNDHDKLLSSPNGAGNDIFGTWQLNCPEITKQWGHDAIYRNGNIIWKIHPPVVHDSHSWCSFNQIIVEGVMRIDWKSTLGGNGWKNKKNNFTFRGKSPGDNGFMCDDEWNKGWITFTSEHECNGKFETQFSDKPWAFTGKKVGLKLDGKRPNALEQEYNKLEQDWLKEMMF